jgi:endo-1,4-beta-mannosidase
VIGPAQAARWCDFACMHGYPAYADWSAGPADALLVPFLTGITRWLAGGAPVLFEEFGQSTATAGTVAAGVQVSESTAAQYAAQVLDGLRSAGAIGALLWCFTDYASELYDEPPFDLAVHERFFGLWRADATPKPALAEINDRRGTTSIAASPHAAWIDITPEELAADRHAQLVRLFERYRQR